MNATTSQNTSQNPPQSIWVFRSFLLLTLGYLVFIGIASFYLTGSIPHSKTVLESFLSINLQSLKPNLHNLRDIATNILLYLPLGVLISALQSLRKRLTPFNPSLLLGFCLSISIEITQSFIGRHTDIVDVFSNGTGFVIGYLLTWYAIYQIHLNPAHLIGMAIKNDDGPLNTLCGLRFAYISIAYFTALLPLNISVSLTDIINQLNTTNSLGIPKLILDPFFHLHTHQLHLHSLILQILIFFPLAALSAFIQLRLGGEIVARCAIHCLLFALAIEISQVFILNAYTDVAIILIAPIIGVVIAWAIRFYNPTKTSLSKDRDSIIVIAIAAYAIFIALLNWSPYEFEITSKAIKAKLLHHTNWLPFRAHFSHRSINAAIDIVKEAGLYLPFGALLIHYIQKIKKLRDYSAVFICCTISLIYAFIMEFSQLIVRERYVDITDPLLALAGCFFGTLLLPLFSFKQRDTNK